jgi:tetratricopeptide (TPR) repeat protein
MKSLFVPTLIVAAGCVSQVPASTTNSGIIAELCGGRRGPVPTAESCAKVPFDVALENPRDVREPIRAFREAFWLRSIDCFQHGLAPDWVLTRMRVHAENNVSAAIAVGNFYLLRGDRFEALDAYNNAIAIDPEVPHSYYDRAIVFTQLAETDDALSDIVVAIKLSNLSCADVESDEDLAPIFLEPAWPMACANAVESRLENEDAR